MQNRKVNIRSRHTFCLANLSLNRSKSFMDARLAFLLIFSAHAVFCHLALTSSLSKILRTVPVLAPCGTLILMSVKLRCFKLTVCLGTLLVGLSQRTWGTRKPRSIFQQAAYQNRTLSYTQ